MRTDRKDLARLMREQQAHSESALRAAHDTFRYLVENSPFGVYAVDADFRLVQVSAGAQKVFESIRPLLGRDFAEVLRIIWPEPFATEAIGHFRRTLDTGEPYRAPSTVEQRRDTGTVESYDWKIERVMLPDGRHGVVCHFYDLSERQQFEAALRDSEARLQLALRSAAMGTFVWYVAEDRGEADDRMRAMLGLGPGGPLSLADMLTSQIVPEEREQFAALVAQACDPAGGRLLRTTVRIRQPGGGERQLAITGEVECSGDPAAAVRMAGTAMDITERVRTEEQLRHAQRVQTIGTLAGGVAHEVNNQMTVVVGYGALALQSLGHDHPLRADLSEMVRAAERAARVSQELLTYSRRHVSHHEPHDLSVVVAEMEGALARTLGAHIELVLPRPGGRRRVLADRSQIEQVLINLVSNAHDAMPDGGRVTIAVDDVELAQDFAAAHGEPDFTPGPYVRLTVSDSGIGMSRDSLAKIFEPFYTTKPVGKGTGLGLSTVYGIVKGSGGFVWAYSEPGAGTTMKVYFPALPEGARAESGTPRAAAPGAGLLAGARILLVEDEPAVRAVARKALEGAGCIVHEAENGAIALARLEQDPFTPDVLITDLVMPGIRGRELGEALASRQPATRVLYMSGYSGETVAERGMLPQGAAFIQKPFAPGELTEAVRALVGGP
ncbi:MAG TPA: ATP-binding protein [Gemmatimonadales bacterium]